MVRKPDRTRDQQADLANEASQQTKDQAPRKFADWIGLPSGSDDQTIDGLKVQPPEPRAGNKAPRPKTDAFVRGLGRLALGAFFRKIEVVGAERFPKSGPVIVLANHFNSLVDGAVITTDLPRMPRFLAASTVWDFKPIAPLLDAAGTVPVFRKQDGRDEEGAMSTTFQQATELLAAGGVLAVFPEGISHNEPHVLPLKTGAARIALEAEAVHGPLGVLIVPVCLTFEAKNKFRTRVLVEIGDPIKVPTDHIAQFTSGGATQQTTAAKELTEIARYGLEELAPTHKTWQEARLIGRAAEVVMPATDEQPGSHDLAETTLSRRAIQRGYLWANAEHPERTETLRRDLAYYDTMLRVAGLKGDQLTEVHPTGKELLQHKAGEILSLGVAVPIFCVGLVLNWVPYRILFEVSRRKDLDKRSTWSIFTGIFLFPAFWAIMAFLAGRLAGGAWGAGWGWAAGIAVLVLAPLTGKAALKFIDAYAELAADLKAWAFFRKSTRFNETMVAIRADISEQIKLLSESYREEHPPIPPQGPAS